MRKAVQILLFIVSYVPLYLILFFQNLNSNIFDKITNQYIGVIETLKLNAISIAFFFLIIFSITLYFIFFKIVSQAAPEKFEIMKVNDNNVENLSYLATYILPFIGLKFDTWQNILATIALFYVLGHIYINTNLILTNPTLTFFGYSISNVEDDKGKNKIVIHRGSIKPDTSVNLVHLIKNIYILKLGGKR